MRSLMILTMLAVGGTMTACKKEPEPKPAAKAPKKVEAPPVAQPIFFESGSADLDSAAENRIADKMKASTTWHVLCLGLADSTGDATANKTLSQQRANAAAEQLRKLLPGQGDRVHSYSIGEKVSDGQSALDRRVQFIFFKNNGQTMSEVVAAAGIK